jgi:hypothetical protein
MLRNVASITFGLLSAFSLFGAEPTLRVGFAEVDVSPVIDKKKPVFVAGFGHDRKATELHDPIMARAVVLAAEKRKIAMVCVDVVGLFLPLVESVRKELPDYSYVLVSSTHNHEGPDTLGLWGPSPFSSGVDAGYLKKVEAGIVKAVNDAEAGLKPVSAKIGILNAPDLLNDSRLPIVKQDELVVIEFTNAETAARHGLLIEWSCHPETLGSKNTRISADFVYQTVNDLRKSQGCPVAYFTGAVGGLMSSLKVPLKNAKGEILKDGTFEKTEEYGRMVAKEAEKILKTAKPAKLVPFEIRTREVHIPVDNQLYKLGWQVGVLRRSIHVWEDTPYPKNPKEAKDLSKRGAIKTEIGYLKLGDIEIAVIPGEIYPELVLGKVQDPPDPGADFPDAPVEPSIYGQFKGKYRMLIGLGNDEIGYIIPKRQWDEKAPFCYGLKNSQYGEINSVGPEAAPILCATFEALVNGKK